MYAEDKKLAEQCGALIARTRDAGAWLRDNAELAGRDLDAQLAELRRAERLFRRCETAAKRKMCAGVFGPSQSGKSYLISALARNEQGELWAVLGDATHDFIREINPPGGRESTGLVTRFTMTRPEGVPQGFPVHVRLLSEADLVKIFANTFYADAEHKKKPERDALLAALDGLEKARKAEVQPGVTLDDMEDIQEYLGRNFQSRARVQFLESFYWERASRLAPYLELADRAELFSLIWDGLGPFTALFRTLAAALRELGGADEAFCPLAALIPREASIIDVATLNTLSKGSDSFEVATREGRRATLPRAVVTALTAELSISMRDKPAGYFEHTDLLDFPGYRSRLKIEDLEREIGKEGLLEGLYLRGKVAWLFERYCAEKELTSLLLCIGSGPQEVQDLPGVINDWVNSTHGETPRSRGDKPSSLLFVLTKADVEFDEKAGTPEVATRWDDRLESSLLNFFGKQHAWPREWDEKGPFNNLFLLRNPNFKFDKILDYDGDTETGLRAGKEEYVARLKESFMASAAARAHFSDREGAWNALMRLNDGGISRIREALAPLCDPSLKRAQIRTTLAERLARVTARLRPFWKTDDKEQLRAEKKELGMALGRLLFGMAQNQRFGQFLRQLMLRDQELYDLYFQARYRIEEESAEAAAQDSGQDSGPALGARVSADDMFAELFGPEAAAQTPAQGAGTVPAVVPSASAAGSAAPPVPKDEAAAFVARIGQFWLRRLRALEEHPALLQYFGLPGPELAKLTHELDTGMERLGVRGAVEEALRAASRYANMEKERVIWKQASLAAGVINGYVNWLGLDPRQRSDAERTVSVGGKARTVFTPPPPFSGLPALAEDPLPYDRAFYTDWAAALVTLINDNAAFDGGRKFNPEQNARLKAILDGLRLGA